MLISKLKDLASFKPKIENPIDIEGLQSKLSTGLFDVMEKSFVSRKAAIDNSSFNPSDVDKIIDGYATKNMIAAAASSIVPGPLGMLGAIPELIINFGNQMFMIYDLGCAHDKEDFINKDLLLDIPFSVLGGNTDLSQLQSQANLIDSPQQALMEKATGLGKTMVDKTLKKSIIQFVPIAGPIIMGTWSKVTTSKIAKTSTSFYDNNLEFKEHFKKEETSEISQKVQVEKIKALANLIECNEDINEEQLAFLAPIIENIDLPQSRKNHFLEEAAKVGSNFQLDYQTLIEYEEDANLMMELVIMAKRSGHIDQLEKKYIHQVGRDLDFDSVLLKQLISEA